ncbi:divalent-cation tolerance protein CutA [[Actinomadura] parvosata subsp. kistnae]|uniref:Divalent-cation tolerance protein CutA n=1 Tax=[Actinomadura] parvosata subsp. kistnae TaxID=1909395 RepID=A0A1V0ALN2_9ACTN|nr:divalent-cation tolerance protein CutA [Nonomuraea sp. ATCC 55076]AQZ71134.1 divalent-cation tolerance protein CutA [Nonomuraea sp. ATCC 55076]
MAEFVEVHVTVPDRDAAERIADVVVGERLAAAAQLVAPITSVYWWRGEVNRAKEWLLFMKTTAERFDELAAAIRELHPYEVPQIIAVPLVAGTADYLEWIRQETSPEPGV